MYISMHTGPFLSLASLSEVSVTWVKHDLKILEGKIPEENMKWEIPEIRNS
jgi:hypothetical protein